MMECRDSVTFHKVIACISGFRGGDERAAPPLLCIFKTFFYDPNPSNRPSSVVIITQSRWTEVFIRRGEGEESGGLGPLFLNFLDPPLAWITRFVNIVIGDTNDSGIWFYRENIENRTRWNTRREQDLVAYKWLSLIFISLRGVVIFVSAVTYADFHQAG